MRWPFLCNLRRRVPSSELEKPHSTRKGHQRILRSPSPKTTFFPVTVSFLCCGLSHIVAICIRKLCNAFKGYMESSGIYKDYYLASSVGGQMNEILRCDWLPERARESFPACSGLPAASRKKKFPESHIINPLLTKLVRSRWLDIGLVLF